MRSEYLGFGLDGADYKFPLAAERIAEFRELLRTGLRLSIWQVGEEPAADVLAAEEHRAEHDAEEIVDELIYGVPPKLAAFLGAGQSPEVVEQIRGWLAMVLNLSTGAAANDTEVETWGKASREYVERRTQAGTPEGIAYTTWLESLPPAKAAEIGEMFSLCAPEDLAGEISCDLQMDLEKALLIARELGAPDEDSVETLQADREEQEEQV